MGIPRNERPIATDFKVTIEVPVNKLSIDPNAFANLGTYDSEMILANMANETQDRSLKADCKTLQVILRWASSCEGTLEIIENSSTLSGGKAVNMTFRFGAMMYLFGFVRDLRLLTSAAV